jgi:hypothetical protein
MSEITTREYEGFNLIREPRHMFVTVEIKDGKVPRPLTSKFTSFAIAQATIDQWLEDVSKNVPSV